MKIIFKCCCVEKEMDYVEQTPENIIESDFQEWLKQAMRQPYIANWEYK